MSEEDPIGGPEAAEVDPTLAEMATHLSAGSEGEPEEITNAVLWLAPAPTPQQDTDRGWSRDGSGRSCVSDTSPTSSEVSPLAQNVFDNAIVSRAGQVREVLGLFGVGMQVVARYEHRIQRTRPHVSL